MWSQTSRVGGYREGSPASGPLQKHPQPVVPYGVSTVPDVTLFEAELPGLEGRCVRARHFGNSVAPLIVLTGLEWGAPARGLLQKHPQPVVPYGVSTVLGNPLAGAKKPAPGKVREGRLAP